MDKIILPRIPAVKVVIIFIIGIIFAEYVALSVQVAFYCVGLLLLFAGLLKISGNFNSIGSDILFAAVIFFAAVFHFRVVTGLQPQHHISRFAGIKEKVTIRGTIISYPVIRDSLLRCDVDVEHIYFGYADSVAVEGAVRLKSIYRGGEILTGMQLIATGKLKQPRGVRNPGEFNYRKYLNAHGIYGCIGVYDSSQITLLRGVNKLAWWKQAIADVRNFLEAQLNRGFQGQNRAFLKGLILGERGEIEPEIKEAFSTTGVMHVLAVSGLHVGFIVVIFGFIFLLCRLPMRARILLTMAGVFIYCMIIGFKAPVVRATLLVELYFLSKLLQRQVNTVNLVATAGLIILLFRPDHLFQPSFQLSFAAVLAIIFFYQRLKTLFSRDRFYNRLTAIKPLEYLVELLLVSIAATCGTLPLVIYYFEKMPLLSILLNIVVIPVVGVIIAVGFVYLLFASFVWPVAGFCALLLQSLLNFLIGVVQLTAAFPLSYIEIYQARVAHLFLIYLLLVLLFTIHKRLSRRMLAAVAIVLLAVMTFQGLSRSPHFLELTYLDVGQGDSAFIRFPNGKTMLIDGGDCTEYVNCGQRHVVPFLKRHGVTQLDALIMTHADNDHIGGLPYLLRQIEVKQVFDSGVPAEHELYQDYVHVIDSLGIERQVLHAGEQLYDFGRCGVFVLSPDSAGQFENLNNSSVVLQIVFNERSFLFTGDIEEPVEQYLLKYGRALKCDVLKIAHHGSKSSSIEEFLKFAAPDYAVISVGEYNRFNHPAQRVLERLSRFDIDVIRTDENGAVIFRSDGMRLERRR